MRLFAAAAGDHLGHYGLRDEFLAKAQQRLKAASLLGILFQAHLLQAQPVQFCLQVAVLLADVMQVNVVVPGIAEEVSSGHKGALHRGDGADGPDAYKAGAASAVGVVTLEVCGQAYDLNHEDRHEHERVLVAAEKTVHESVPGLTAWAQ